MRRLKPKGMSYIHYQHETKSLALELRNVTHSFRFDDARSCWRLKSAQRANLTITRYINMTCLLLFVLIRERNANYTFQHLAAFPDKCNLNVFSTAFAARFFISILEPKKRYSVHSRSPFIAVAT